MRLSLLSTAIAATLAGCSTVNQKPPQVAVAFDAEGIVGIDVRGTADPQSGRPVTIDDPVRIASVSKLVLAIGLLRLSEEGALHPMTKVEDVLGYPLDNPHTGEGPVRIAHLLNHTSGLRDTAGYALPLGARLQDHLSNPDAWANQPWNYFHYSNLNYVVLASAMEAATGERFDRLMDRLVLDPLKLDACYNWPSCSDEAIARAVVLQREGTPVWDDLGGRRPDCPVVVRDGEPCDLDRWRAGENGALFSPQGGLRISARDLSRIGRMLINRGHLDGTRILSPSTVNRMLVPRWVYDGRNGETWGEVFCMHGWGVHFLATRGKLCNGDLGLPPGRWFGHSGEAYGLRSGIWIDRHRNVGIVYHAGGEPESTPEDVSWTNGFHPTEKLMAARATRMLPAPSEAKPDIK